MKYLDQHAIVKKIPRETIESAFTKSKETWTDVLHIKGPGRSAFLIEILAKDVFEVRFLMNYILQKFSFKYDDASASMPKFDKYGVITAKHLKNCGTRPRELTPDLRTVNAFRVIELKNTKRMKFLCSPSVMLTTSKKLEALDYEIESTEIQYFPKERVVLEKAHHQICEEFVTALKNVPNVLSIYDNYMRQK